MRFDVLVTEDGRQRTLEGGLTTRPEAEAFLAHFHVKNREAGLFVPQDTGILTVRKLGVLYLAGITDRTRRTNKSRWNARVLTAEFADWPLTQLSERAVRRWIDTMARSPIVKGGRAGKRPERGTLQTALSCLRSALRFAVIEGHIDTNVAANVEISDSTMAAPKATRAGEGFDFLHEDEVKLILGSERLPQRQRTAFVLLAFSGARPKDLYLLTWDRVDVKAGIVRYHSHKRERDYFVHLLPSAHEVIRAWWIKCGRPGRGLVFAGPEGKPHAPGYDWGWADTRGVRTWKKRNRAGEVIKYKSRQGVKGVDGWRTKIGIRRDVPLYSLRHTCASHLLLGTKLFTGGKEWTEAQVASQLGHADLTTVRRYVVALGLASKRAAEESREALRLLGNESL